MIEGDCKIILDRPVIGSINLEKTGVQDITHLCRTMPLIQIHSLNLASNNLKSEMIDEIIKMIGN